MHQLQCVPWKKLNNFIQIFHINENHWICAERNTNTNNIQIYDSLNKNLKRKYLGVVARYACLKDDIIKLDIMNVHQQRNTFDCGFFALAFAMTLAIGKHPTQFNFVDVRGDSIKILNSNKKDYSTVVSSRRNKIIKHLSAQIYCVCRSFYINEPDKSMTACDNCNKWFHDACVILKNKNNLCKKCGT